MTLDPTVKFHLQQHLVNVHHQEKASAIKIGKLEQLKTATKISSSKKIEQCFDWQGTPKSYPKLPERSYLVACADRWIDVQVFTIYSLEQMKQIQQQCNAGYANKIDWRILEISKELEADLLKGVCLEDGLILTTPEAFWGKDLNSNN